MANGPARTVTAGIRARAARAPEAPAIAHGARRLDFAGLIERTDRVATGAQGLGLDPGRRAVIFAPNCLEYIELTLGLSEAQVAPVLAGATLAPRELSLLCDDCAPRVIFAHPTLEETARAAELDGVELVVLADEYEDWLEASRPARVELRATGEEPFVIRYTSGTAGRPKGVAISQRASLARYGLHGSAFGIEGAGERNLAVSPLSAGTAMTFALTTLLAGGSCAVMPMFHPAALLRELGRGEVTTVALVPAHVRPLLELAEAAPLRAGRLRVLTVGGAALSPDERERVSRLLGDVLHIVYGSTETGTIAVLGPEDARRRPGSVGRPFAGVEVSARNDDGTPAAPGEPGELHVRSTFMFDGYWGRPEETSAALARGFYATGDLGFFDSDGFVHLTGRIDDRINSGGFSFHPSQIEEVLLSHPGVAEAVVYGATDDRLGEAVYAVVVCAPGASEDETELLAYASERLARERRPVEIELVEAIPRTPAGKISRRALRDRRSAPAPAPPG